MKHYIIYRYCIVYRYIDIILIFFFFTEHSVPIDIDKLNREIIEQDYNLWDALESSKWIPCDTLELCY